MGRYSGKTCRLILMLVITVVFFVAEIVAGYMGNSIALVSDSFNMLSDILSLCVGLTAARVSRRAGSGRFTYGMGRAEVVGTLANAVFLAALCFSVSMESLKRLALPQAIDDPTLVLIVGALGLAVNVLGLLVFQDYRCLCAARQKDAGASRKEDGEVAEEEAGLQDQKAEREGPPLNIRGVLLHVLNDALGSVVVVVASALFYVWPLAPESPCNWQCYVDPSLTLIMVAIIMSSAVPLVKETAGILLQMSPADLRLSPVLHTLTHTLMSPADLRLSPVLESVCKLPGVTSVHEAHVWELSKGRNVASLHVRVCPELADLSWAAGPAGRVGLHGQILQVFHRAGVHSVTVQLERAEGETDTGHCSGVCVSPACVKLSCCPAGATSVSVCDGKPSVSVCDGNSSSPSGDVAVDMLNAGSALLRDTHTDTHSLNTPDKCAESTKF
ncbi:zinc transporter 10 [Rhinichthys klamathensis goyatoka]|uniref:zinc transporter 10 n=1 Tax=Rhinichthys klamathensis goyatoka TaxID=3034132 RepID=UPI0024B493FB|nr:zinc transporter 10 [Rhinichthys klamathensis goyatoka]